MEQKTRIVIAEDHEIMRESLIALLDGHDDIIVVGEAKDGLEATQSVHRLEPDVLLLDYRMPQMNGLEVIQEVAAKMPGLKIIVLTMHKDEDLAIEVLKAGAKGFCLKTAGYNELLLAIRTVLKDKIYASPEILERVFQGYLESKRCPKKKSTWDGVTRREKEVLKLVGEGYRNKEIAGFLNVSVKTVEKHRANLMQKLDLHTASSLTAYAMSKGLVVNESSQS
jgi:two-component system, NarL family, response regulator NreC